MEANQKQQYRISEHINFIKSKDDSFLEKQFSVLGLKNKTFNSQNDFTLIINFSNTEGPYEYLYLLNETKCHSYLLTDGKKTHSKNVKECENKLTKINSLKNSLKNKEFAFNRDLLIIWRLNEGKYELQVYHEVTGKQLDLMENIFYDSNK
ncbi:hypothetical protein ASG21_12860 [Chryseobacterium sp. Leaf394]|nr:hypothetical protein ASG21_12860 [Chryseobacterium sp. Leaf394]